MPHHFHILPSLLFRPIDSLLSHRPFQRVYSPCRTLCIWCRPVLVLLLPVRRSVFPFFALLFLPRVTLLQCYLTHFHCLLYMLNFQPYDLSAGLCRSLTISIQLSSCSFLVCVTILYCFSSFNHIHTLHNCDPATLYQTLSGSCNLLATPWYPPAIGTTSRTYIRLPPLPLAVI